MPWSVKLTIPAGHNAAPVVVPPPADAVVDSALPSVTFAEVGDDVEAREEARDGVRRVGAAVHDELLRQRTRRGARERVTVGPWAFSDDEPDVARDDLRHLAQQPVPGEALAEGGRERGDAALMLLRQPAVDGIRSGRRRDRRVLGLRGLRARCAAARPASSRRGT